MRPTQKQNRSRGRGSRKPNGNNLNRVYESAGPEGKVRGTPQQIIDKYLTLARDAQTSGDRVVAENFLQHAEHYQRILLEAMGARADRRDHLSEQDQPDFDMLDDELDTEDQLAEAPEEPRPGGDPRQGADFRQGGDGDGPRRPRRPRQTDAALASEQPSERPLPEVSGLTTIDSRDGDGESLLVDAEELSASQPRRRRRRSAPAADAAPAAVPEASAQPD